MAAASERAEFILGELFTFSGVVNAGIRIIDQYSRWEVLVSLQEHVSFLAHPAAPMVLLIAGLILIQRSIQRTLARSLKEAQESRLHDESGNRIVPTVAPPRIMTTVWFVFAGVIVAGIFAVFWIATYSPKAPRLVTKLEAPKICKTADCWPKSINRTVGRPAAIISVNASSGSNAIGPVTGNNNIVSPTVNNFGPPPRRILDGQREQLIACLKQKPGKFEINAVSGNTDAFVYAKDWYEVFKAAGWDPKSTVILPFEIGGGIWYGIQLYFRGSGAPGALIEFDSESPEGTALLCIQGIPGASMPSPNFPTGQVEVFVGPSPPPM